MFNRSNLPDAAASPALEKRVERIVTEQNSQAEKFREAARELECDEDEAAFEDKVLKVATAPKPEEPK